MNFVESYKNINIVKTKIKRSEDMALLKCPDCGKEFSENASFCPECGCSIKIAKEEKLLNDLKTQ